MIDPIHVVNGEVQNVLAAMRLNRRWASSTPQVGIYVSYTRLTWNRMEINKRAHFCVASRH